MGRVRESRIVKLRKYIPFEVVVKAFRNNGIEQSPLLYPSEKIEEILRRDNLISGDENLIFFDGAIESFKVGCWNGDELGQNNGIPVSITDTWLKDYGLDLPKNNVFLEYSFDANCWNLYSLKPMKFGFNFIRDHDSIQGIKFEVSTHFLRIVIGKYGIFLGSYNFS